MTVKNPNALACLQVFCGLFPFQGHFRVFLSRFRAFHKKFYNNGPEMAWDRPGNGPEMTQK